MWQAYAPYPHNPEWDVRRVSPADFLRMSPAESTHCYWTREEAVNKAISQNKFALRNIQDQSADIEAKNVELQGRNSRPSDSMRGVLTLAQQSEMDKQDGH